MGKFIELTDDSDNKYLIQSSEIIIVYADENQTVFVTKHEGKLFAKESYETVKQMILEAGK